MFFLLIYNIDEELHEKIIGAVVTCSLPEGFDLYHFKTIDKQEKQNNYYNTI
jgi:hypothetical protein